MKLHPIITLALTVSILIGLTTFTVLYAEGWRFNTQTKTIQKTGMLAIRSIPEGAKVYLNNKVLTATNDTIQSLTPGNYSVKVQKDGFEVWTKELDVYPELVTDITAVLVSQSPRIEPLTNTGVSTFTLSSSLDKIAYSTKNTERPGIWMFPLSNITLNLFKTNPNLIAEDTEETSYSNAENIWWSPDDSEILVQMNKEGYYLIDLQRQGSIPLAVTTSEPIFEKWKKEKLKKRTAFLEKQEIDKELKEIALNDSTIWSPDDKKILYLKYFGDMVEINIFNMEDPLPVSETRKYTTYRTKRSTLKNISWYPDSYHLILLEDKTISIIRIDGTNKTEVFSANGNLISDNVFPSPWGDKIIILASFKQNALPDLYAVGIR